MGKESLTASVKTKEGGTEKRVKQKKGKWPNRRGKNQKGAPQKRGVGRFRVEKRGGQKADHTAPKIPNLVQYQVERKNSQKKKKKKKRGNSTQKRSPGTKKIFGLNYTKG